MLCEDSPAGPDSVILVKPDAETFTDPVQEVIHSSTYVSSVIPTQGGISLNSEEPFCRICHEGSGAGDLLSPCECAGSLAMVHRVCLERWLTASGTSCCELCHFEFALERLPKPITEWFTTPSMQQQRRTLCGDAICFLFITPLASLSGWLCVQGAMDLYYSNGMEAVGLIVLTLTLFTIYLFWTVAALEQDFKDGALGSASMSDQLDVDSDVVHWSGTQIDQEQLFADPHVYPTPILKGVASQMQSAYFLPEFALSPQGSFLEDTTGEQYLTYRYDDQT
ncbi:E3 ubiquitin- ligase MARCH3-like protein [Labeo rohita]|uniref:E3 ubiquitin-ligase MARCH3-like protein n=1 Tax=Labeo rohita TaxID=84645 RepID=A0A498M0A1_LABRO|nr:E3 ubiquitin- ligase MARCH3-like protein [Labeo rohita]